MNSQRGFKGPHAAHRGRQSQDGAADRARRPIQIQQGSYFTALAGADGKADGASGRPMHRPTNAGGGTKASAKESTSDTVVMATTKEAHARAASPRRPLATADLSRRPSPGRPSAGTKTEAGEASRIQNGNPQSYYSRANELVDVQKLLVKRRNALPTQKASPQASRTAPKMLFCSRRRRTQAQVL